MGGGILDRFFLDISGFFGVFGHFGHCGHLGLFGVLAFTAREISNVI